MTNEDEEDEEDDEESEEGAKGKKSSRKMEYCWKRASLACNRWVEEVPTAQNSSDVQGWQPEVPVNDEEDEEEEEEEAYQPNGHHIHEPDWVWLV